MMQQDLGTSSLASGGLGCSGLLELEYLSYRELYL